MQLWALLREIVIMLLEIYALLWNGLRETVLLLRRTIMKKKALLLETEPIKEKLRLKYSFKLQVNELRGGEGLKLIKTDSKPLPKPVKFL